ncbi:potassium channel family protein [Streptomyces xantholiticus]
MGHLDAVDTVRGARRVFHVKLPGQDAMARHADEHLVTGRVKLPRRIIERPLRQVSKRLLMALMVLAITVLIVYTDRVGYHDNSDETVDLLDAVYYATVTLSTTGYGDIVPYSDGARLTNVLLITPLRVLFLIILVGTTLEVLTERTREEWRLNRWRSNLRDHTVIVGFGTKGRSAMQTLCATGLNKDQIVIVDPSAKVIDAANAEGFVGVVGDATRSDVLIRAELQRARQIVIAPQRDDTAVLVTLTARQLNRGAKIVAAVREEENAPLLRQSGADAVITSSGAAGRLLGLSVLSPSAGTVMEDLIQQGSGLDLIERPVIKAEVGRSVRETEDLVVSVLRGHRLLGYDDPAASPLQLTDRLITIVRAENGSLPNSSE